MCGRKPCAECAARKSQISGTMKKKVYRRASKPNVKQMLPGIAVGIAGDEALNMLFSGFLTDQTGRYLKMGAGVLAVMMAKQQFHKGIGAGVAVNNAYASFLSKNNKTLGGEVISLVSPTTVAGLPWYAERQLAQRRANVKVAV